MDFDQAQWLHDYLGRFAQAMASEDAIASVIQLKTWMLACSDGGGKVAIAGNGGSQAIASHSALDITKQAKIRTVCFTDAALITAFSNDYGCDRWMAEAVGHYVDPEHLAVLIRSSGRSTNMVAAAQAARERAPGNLNFWVDSRAYNVV